MQQFRDRVAVITGGASGIGYATAERLAGEGMKIVIADVEPGALEAAVKKLEGKGASVLGVRTDVSKAEDIERLAQKTLERFGGVHVLFNNAGVAVTGETWENSLSDWEWVVGVNLWGVVYGIRTFVPIMLRQNEPAHVVSTASMAGLTSNPGMAVYNVTKHAVVTISETLHHDLALRGAPIKASVLCPGFINTRIMDSARNRQSDAKHDPPTTPEASALGASIELALREGINQGFPPSFVADRVFEAIRDEKFYIFAAQPEILDAVKQRLDEVGAQRNPGTPTVLTE
jgi:NAD(P)-dependent dehydrogenase (short-subunit alcohol dehydrogenase family)